MWSTGPVGKVQRAVLQDGEVIAVADTMEHAARMVRLLNRAESRTVRIEKEIEGAS